LAACPPAARTRALHDLRAIAQDVAVALCRSRQGGHRTAVDVWELFCESIALDPTLATCPDPIPALQLFAHRYRSGEIAPGGAKVRGKTVGDAVRAVGQAFASMGLPDPRLTATGQLDLHLSRQLSSYNKHDCPPTRVKPIPLSILHPPFWVRDVHLFRNGTCMTPQHLLAGHLTTFVALEFTTQKNGVKGELIGLGPSGVPTFCPVHAVRNRLLALIQNQAPIATPIYTYHAHRQAFHVTSVNLTSALRVAVQVVGLPLGLTPADISIRSLRSSGAMALLCANVDTDRIRLLGRWRSDEMLRYLHVQAVPVVAPIASAMLRNGHFTLLPNQPLPAP